MLYGEATQKLPIRSPPFNFFGPPNEQALKIPVVLFLIELYVPVEVRLHMTPASSAFGQRRLVLKRAQELSVCSEPSHLTRPISPIPIPKVAPNETTAPVKA